MAKDILVGIVSNDLFSRNWMSLLLVRDWRTRVVSEFKDDFELRSADFTESPRIDILIVDVDSLQKNPGMIEALNTLHAKMPNTAKVLCIGTQVEPKVFLRLNSEILGGYLLKDEIQFSLGWAITFISDKKKVLTPGVLDKAYSSCFQVPSDHIVIRGRSFPGLTDRQEEIARLAIIFSIGRRDLADELKISDQWSYGMVSELYGKLGLNDIFDNGIDPYQVVINDPIIQNHVEEIITQLGDSKKARDLETLAFHLLTMPYIEK